MKTALISTINSVLVAGFLAGCGDDKTAEPPDDSPKKATAAPATPETTPKRAASLSAGEIDAELNALLGSDSPTDSASTEFSPEIEAQIDSMINGRANFREIMEDPEFKQLMNKLTEGWRPDEKMQERMKSATQLLITSQFPDADLDRESPGHPGIEIIPSDMRFLRLVIGRALQGDREQFFEGIATFAESAALQMAIDPDADAGIKVEKRSEAETTRQLERARRADAARQAEEEARKASEQP